MIPIVVIVLIAGLPSTASGQKEGTAAKQPPATAQAQAAKSNPKDQKSPTKVDDQKRFQPFGYVQHTQEITFSGRALNEDGEPVEGARIFVIPVIPNGVAYGKREVIAEGRTGADGRYRFESVKVSVLEFAPQAVPRPIEALFQVFGLAEGYGYVWRRAHAFRPEKSPANSDDGAKPVGEIEGGAQCGRRPER